MGQHPPYMALDSDSANVKQAAPMVCACVVALQSMVRVMALADTGLRACCTALVSTSCRCTRGSLTSQPCRPGTQLMLQA